MEKQRFPVFCILEKEGNTFFFYISCPSTVIDAFVSEGFEVIPARGARTIGLFAFICLIDEEALEEEGDEDLQEV